MKKVAKAAQPKTASATRKPAASDAAHEDDRKDAAIEQQRLWRDSPSETAAMTDMPDPDKVPPPQSPPGR